jgi:hypothetical protein
MVAIPISPLALVGIALAALSLLAATGATLWLARTSPTDERVERLADVLGELRTELDVAE